MFAQQIAAPDGALDWRRGDWDDLIHAPIALPPPIEAALQNHLASFGLVFDCFDFALTGDGDRPEDWWAIECNPNGQRQAPTSPARCDLQRLGLTVLPQPVWRPSSSLKPRCRVAVRVDQVGGEGQIVSGH
ncbi:hypothetical protein [Streptomyces sp. NPDC001970]